MPTPDRTTGIKSIPDIPGTKPAAHYDNLLLVKPSKVMLPFCTLSADRTQVPDIYAKINGAHAHRTSPSKINHYLGRPQHITGRSNLPLRYSPKLGIIAHATSLAYERLTKKGVSVGDMNFVINTLQRSPELFVRFDTDVKKNQFAADFDAVINDPEQSAILQRFVANYRTFSDTEHARGAQILRVEDAMFTRMVPSFGLENTHTSTARDLSSAVSKNFPRIASNYIPFFAERIETFPADRSFTVYFETRPDHIRRELKSAKETQTTIWELKSQVLPHWQHFYKLQLGMAWMATLPYFKDLAETHDVATPDLKLFEFATGDIYQIRAKVPWLSLALVSQCAFWTAAANGFEKEKEGQQNEWGRQISMMDLLRQTEVTKPAVVPIFSRLVTVEQARNYAKQAYAMLDLSMEINKV